MSAYSNKLDLRVLVGLSGSSLSATVGALVQIECPIGSFLQPSHLPINVRNQFNKILLAYGIVSTKPNENSITGGDSGSIILLDEPRLTNAIVGLAFTSNTATTISYIIPINLIIDDIKRATGLKVLLPTLVGSAPGDTPH
ncbi:hypothetical protein J1614_000536 [Plenodomus biglobosus]|nr:hypothetical protein J1614_000536 [Plenodomus biglobosus]